jgi:hypothetical protein
VAGACHSHPSSCAASCAEDSTIRPVVLADGPTSQPGYGRRAARHSVQAGDPACRYLPGEFVTLDAGEAAAVTVVGFLQSTPAVLPGAGTIQNPANIGRQGGDVQGPKYT